MPTTNRVESALALIKDDPSKILGLTVGGHKIETPGQFVPKADSHSSPQLTCKLPAGTYLVIAIDPDAPLPSLPVLGPILHWIQPGLSSERPDDPTSPLISKAPFVANYIGASPPPIGGPHKYLFMLHEQPADFDGSKFAPPGGQDLGKLARMLYTSKLEKFEKDTKLGPIIAANYFTSN